MNKVLSLLSIAASLAFFPAHANVDYAERVEVFSTSTGPVEVIHRNVILPNKSGVESVGISQSLATQGGQVLSSSTSTSGFVKYGSTPVHYQIELGQHDFKDMQNILDYYTVTSWMGSDPHVFGADMTIGFPGGYQVPLPSLDLYQESMGRMQILQYQSQAYAEAWAKMNEKQREQQKRVVEASQNRVYKFREQSQQNYSLNLGTNLSLQETQESLSQSLNDLNLANAIGSQKGKLEAIRLSPDRQKRLEEELDGLFESSPRQAGAVVSDLFSPLAQNTSPDVQGHLRGRGVQNGVLPGPVIGSEKIKFKDPNLEDRRLRLQNELQAMGRSNQKFMSGQGLNGVRTVQTRLKHAQKLEEAGQLDLAREKMAQAEEVVDEGLSHKGWTRDNYVEALNELYDSPGHTQNFVSQDAEFLKTAEPLAGVFESTLAEYSSSSNSEAREKSTAAKRGLELLQQADQASSQGEKSEAEFYKGLAVGAVDIITGFVPPAALVKDSYEAVTGHHWITGKKLSNFERALAVGGILTLGVGSGATKALARSLYALEKQSAGLLLRQGRQLSGAFKKAYVRSEEAVGQVISNIRNSQPAIRTFEGAEQAILNTGKSIHMRMKSVGFDTRTLELVPTNQLNRSALKSGDLEYAIPNRWAFRVEAASHPKQLVRAHIEGRQVSNWFFHQDLMSDLAKHAKGYDDFVMQLKNQLNVPKLPTHFSTLKHSKQPYRIEVSEIKQVKGWGKVEGQLQFKVESHLTKENFNSAQTLKSYFESVRGVK